MKLTGETMALKKKLISGFQRMLYNALILPHFDYACPAWYSNINVKLKKLQIMQNKCIWLCLTLNKMHHISEDFKTNVAVFKYVNNVCPYYIKEVFEYASRGRMSSRNNYIGLKVLYFYFQY